jgi:16S rRNA G1207 methylase RsmC
VARLHQLLRLVDVELHAVELAQQVVRELDVRLVDLVDQEHGAPLALERPPQHAGHDVVGDVLDALVPELGIAQP